MKSLIGYGGRFYLNMYIEIAIIFDFFKNSVVFCENDTINIVCIFKRITHASVYFYKVYELSCYV